MKQCFISVLFNCAGTITFSICRQLHVTESIRVTVESSLTQRWHVCTCRRYLLLGNFTNSGRSSTHLWSSQDASPHIYMSPADYCKSLL